MPTHVETRVVARGNREKAFVPLSVSWLDFAGTQQKHDFVDLGALCLARPKDALAERNDTVTSSSPSFEPARRSTFSWAWATVLLAAGWAAAEPLDQAVPLTAAGLPAEAALSPFLGEPKFDVQPLFEVERLPNVVVTTDGTVLGVWGWGQVRVRRSEDGGQSWGPEIAVSSGLNAGGAVVDENAGHVLVFSEEKHPPAPLHVHRSQDQGETWTRQEVRIHADQRGNVPSMCMNERGITLRRGEHAGRLLRPSRWYADGNDRKFWHEHYTNAIYSDDGGTTWHTSAPFPAMGTGEATVAELSDGRIYYNSRRHWAPEGETNLMRHVAYSDDGGQTWKDLSVSQVLYDGGGYGRGYGLMAGLVRLPVIGRDILVFSNTDTQGGERRSMTVWASFDGGRTWPVKRLVYEGPSAYSSLAAGRPGTTSQGWIYLLFEAGDRKLYEDGRIARFNLAWLLDGEPTGDGTIPTWAAGG
jgi:sialidase-1